LNSTAAPGKPQVHIEHVDAAEGAVASIGRPPIGEQLGPGRAGAASPRSS
jgi:hypothetical protein